MSSNKLTKQKIVDTSAGPAKNFGLTPEAFDLLLHKLKARDETLFQTIFLAHFEDCMNYLKSRFSLQHERAYDITMDTLLIFRRRLLEGKIRYGNIRFLFTRMASQLYLKEINRQLPKEEMSEIQAMLDETEEPIDEESLGLLRQAWEKLCETCQNLLRRFYYHQATLKEIAEEQQKNAAALRKQKQRCVEKLRLHFKQLHRQ